MAICINADIKTLSCAEINPDDLVVKKDDLLKKIFEIDKFELTSENDEIEIEVGEMFSFSKNHIKQETKSVLGLDIYKYSEYNDEKQPLIPLIFDTILDHAIKNATEDDPVLFKNMAIRNNFISTGDGGFIIFPTPLHALMFNMYFFTVLHVFNCGHFSPRFSRFMGEITIRSTITYDKIFNYENNWYGKAIIKNARILHKDNLNRFIIDKETYTYFMRNFNGIESLQVIDNKILEKVINADGKIESSALNGNLGIIKNIHVQKIQDILAKSTQLNIYNVEIQLLSIVKINEQSTLSYIFTLGNTNIGNIQ